MRVSGPAEACFRLLGNLHVRDRNISHVFDHGIGDGAGQASGERAGTGADACSAKSVNGSSDGGAGGHAGEDSPIVGMKRSCSGGRVRLRHAEDLGLQCEVRPVRIFEDPVALGGDRRFEGLFNVEVRFIGRVADLEKDRAFVLSNGLQKDGVAHLGLHVEIGLGNGRVDGRAAAEEGEYRGTDRAHGLHWELCM